MAQVIAAFTDFPVGSQDAVHGADRAMVDALVEQDGVDLGGCLVGKTRRGQKVEDGPTFPDSQRAPWARPGPKRGQRPGQTGTPTVDAGARHVQGRAGAGGQTGSRRQRDDRCRHDLSSLSGVASGIPSRAATFFWISMIASACSNLRPSRAFSRLACASSAVKGFRAVGFGPRLAGVSAPRAPLTRCRRQPVRVDEYKPSRRRIAPIPPTSVAPSISARTRSFVCAVKVRRRGRSDISGTAAAGGATTGALPPPPPPAAAGAGTTVGLRPPSAPAPAASSVFVSLCCMTTMVVLRPQG